MKQLFTIFLSLACLTSFAQTDAPAKKQVFMYVEQMPEFNGDWAKYISEHLKYPKEAQKKGIEGRVTIRFMVNEDGSISDVTVIRSVHPLIDKEALRVISEMPKWKPGRQNGKPVNVWFTQPILFSLQNTTAPAK